MFKKLRRIMATILSVLLVSGLVTPVNVGAQHANEIPLNALSYGYGGQLDLRLLEGLLTGDGFSIAELKGTEQSWIDGDSPNPQDKAQQELDLEALQLINLNLGTIDLPLVGPGGLLEFTLDEATLGAVHEFANAKTPNEAYGAVGLVGSDGSTVDLTRGGEGDPYASINLLSLLNLQQSELFTSTLISDASLQLGVLGTKAERHNIGDAAEALCTGMNQVVYSDLHHPDLTHPILGEQYFTVTPALEASGLDDKRFCSDYRIADAKIIIDAPVVKDLMATVETELRVLEAALNSSLAAGGTLDSILQAVGAILTGTLSLLNEILGLLGITVLDALELSVTAQVPVADVLEPLVATPLSDANELVAIDLDAGTIEIDLQKVHKGDLSDLAPNTPLLTSSNINAIAGTVTSLLTDSKADNSRGLMARLQNTLEGDPVTHTNGLYDTKLSISLLLDGLTVANPLPLLPDLTLAGGTLTIDGTLGQLLNNSGFTFSGTGTLGAVDLLGSLVTTLVEGVGPLVEALLFDGPDSLVSALIGRLGTNDVVSLLVTSLSPLLKTVLQPVANAIINRQTVEQIDQGNLLTVTALELNVLTLSGNAATNQSEDRLIGLPIATAAVLAQHWDLIDLDLNVAKVGSGRGLHPDGYTYDVVCEADKWTGIDATGGDRVSYAAGNIGTGYSYASTQLALTGVTDPGLATPLRALPGSVCTVTTNPPLSAEAALRPTGDTPTRTPYTYFLAESSGGPLVSGVTPAGAPTNLESTRVVVGGDAQVSVDASTVGDEWKTGSFTFVVPDDATSHTVHIVHAYDIDTRDIVVNKGTDGQADVGAIYNFQYSLDGGATWDPDPPAAINAGGAFTIAGVPLIDSTTLAPISVLVREEVPAPGAGGPEVFWAVDGTALPPEPHDGTYARSAAFEAGLGITAASASTPDLALAVTNAYPVDVDFEAMLPATGRTSLVWVFGMGLLLALGALSFFIYSRRR